LRFGNKRIFIAVIAAVILVVLLVGGYLFLKPDRTYLFSEDAKDGQYEMPEIAYQKQLEEMAPTYFQVQINARPTIDSVSGKGNLMIGNPQKNKERVFVSLILDDTEELIFQSDTIKPGERNAYVTLDIIPDPGEYEVTAVFSILEEDSEVVKGEIDVGLVMTVE
jgi:hypothetical protein